MTAGSVCARCLLCFNRGKINRGQVSDLARLRACLAALEGARARHHSRPTGVFSHHKSASKVGIVSLVVS